MTSDFKAPGLRQQGAPPSLSELQQDSCRSLSGRLLAACAAVPEAFATCLLLRPSLLAVTHTPRAQRADAFRPPLSMHKTAAHARCAGGDAGLRAEPERHRVGPHRFPGTQPQGAGTASWSYRFDSVSTCVWRCGWPGLTMPVLSSMQRSHQSGDNIPPLGVWRTQPASALC